MSRVKTVVIDFSRGVCWPDRYVRAYTRDFLHSDVDTMVIGQELILTWIRAWIVREPSLPTVRVVLEDGTSQEVDRNDRMHKHPASAQDDALDILMKGLHR